MNSDPTETCPACEFEAGKTGNAIRQDDAMTCLSCGASWKVVRSATAKPSIPNEHEYRQASTALVDNRVFNKRHYEPSQNRFRMESSSSDSSSAYGFISLCFLLLISAGLFLQTWIWLNPEKDALVLYDVKFEEKTSQNGSNVYKVHGTVSNESSRAIAVPRISIVLRSKDGKPLIRWHHNSPVASLRSNSQKHFTSSIIHMSDDVAYVEASLQR